ncbi:uncharacterized protein LOC114541898 [Dendronephthya gigantea]|uniref:uncharacterized protein LOC114541898 n=1 Tax=Dendronephthya gigantea TaxID=151771 RepID=UPI00106AF75A|nr:uncharacterized protein LOC114541898 [Dendronephthya gigantea]
MSDQLKKQKKVRSGHRGFVATILPEAKAIASDYNIEQQTKATQLKTALTEQVALLEALDKEILKILGEDDEVDEAAMQAEIEKCYMLRSGIKATATLLEKAMSKPAVASTSGAVASTSEATVESLETSEHVGTSPEQATPESSTVRARLPKLEAKRFGGKIEEWQEFWDGFESAIHKNTGLSNVDKFNYLRSLLMGQAKAAIAGVSLTTANYEAAVQLLKKRTRDSGRLRHLIDKIETHYRGLEALGVDEASYSDIVVPAILEKIPEVVRLTITRDKPHSEWSMNDVLGALEGEVELREEYSRPEEEPRKRFNGKNSGLGSGNALHVKRNDDSCAFCLGNHKHQDCKKVELKGRKQILIKYSRCFNCMRKGHRARDCRQELVCEKCKGKHHTALCEESEGNEGEVPADQRVPGAEIGNLHVSSSSRVAFIRFAKPKNVRNK